MERILPDSKTSSGNRESGKLIGSNFLNAFLDMRRAQWLTAEELRVRSDARLSALLKHAAANVPFYSEVYKCLGLAPTELRQSQDLSLLPVLTKSDYRNRQPDEFFAKNIPEYQRMAKTTSGSTGEPFQFWLDRRAQSLIFASHLFYDSWHGLRPFDRYIRIAATPAPPSPLPAHTPVAIRTGQTITTKLQGLYEKLTQDRISVWEVDNEQARNIWQRMETFRPRFVMGYTSALAAVADELLRTNLRLSQPVRGVITIAETLSPARRRLIDDYFGAPIINRYGLREFGSWSAQSCSESPAQFHINTELVICEIVREDDSPCAPGERGRVVLTDLHNFARPFIRYDTGDLAIAGFQGCPCGRGFPLIGSIEGRSQECLRTPSGKEISPVVLGHFLFVYHDHLDVVRHYQLVQENQNRARLLIVPDKGWDDARSSRLQSDLAALLGGEMDVAVETVSEIPQEESGKRPIIKLRDA